MRMRLVAKSCPTLWDPMDCSPSGSSVHGIFQARMLEWVAISSSRGSYRPRDWIHVSCVSCMGRWILYHWATWEHPNITLSIIYLQHAQGDFTSGPVVKNPPTNAGNMGSIPGLGGFHKALGQLSPCARTTEPKPACSRACALQRKPTAMRSPHSVQPEKAC